MDNLEFLYIILCLIFIFISWYLYRVIMRWFHDMLQCMNTIVSKLGKIDKRLSEIDEKLLNTNITDNNNE